MAYDSVAAHKERVKNAPSKIGGIKKTIMFYKPTQTTDEVLVIYQGADYCRNNRIVCDNTGLLYNLVDTMGDLKILAVEGSMVTVDLMTDEQFNRLQSLCATKINVIRR